MTTMSSCGLICTDCQYYIKNECNGCHPVKGKTFWALQHVEGGRCPLYNCAVRLKGFKSCAECSELPCDSFLQLKDPDISEAEHLQAISDRVSRLRKIGQ